jgi:hypothetical protein
MCHHKRTYAVLGNCDPHRKQRTGVFTRSYVSPLRSSAIALCHSYTYSHMVEKYLTTIDIYCNYRDFLHFENNCW